MPKLRSCLIAPCAALFLATTVSGALAAPWLTLGRCFGIGHGPGYHAAAGCAGACGTYGPAPALWYGEPSTFPIPRSGWMISQPVLMREFAPGEAVPAVESPSLPYGQPQLAP